MNNLMNYEVMYQRVVSMQGRWFEIVGPTLGFPSVFMVGVVGQDQVQVHSGAATYALPRGRLASLMVARRLREVSLPEDSSNGDVE